MAGGTENREKLLRQLREFDGYIENNRWIGDLGTVTNVGEKISECVGLPAPVVSNDGSLQHVN